MCLITLAIVMNNKYDLRNSETTTDSTTTATEEPESESEPLPKEPDDL